MAIVPNSDTSLAEAQKIQYNALDIDRKLKVESTQADDAAKKVDTSAGNLYMSIASESVGGGLIKTGLDALVARVGDKNKAAALEPEAGAPGRVSVDEFFGFVRHDAHSITYGGDPKTAKDLSANLLEQAEVTTASLRPPTKDTKDLVQTDGAGNISGLKSEKNTAITNTANVARKLVCEQEYANQAALNAMPAYNQQYSAARGMAMGAGAAPAALHNFSPKDLGALVTDIKETG